VGETLDLGYTALSVHETVDLAAVRAHGVVTQGHLDPTALFGPAEQIAAEVRAIHGALGGQRDHVFNLGHGILPSTPVEGVGAFVQAVRSLP
jgi:uroporphyrinogen decarboxylase